MEKTEEKLHRYGDLSVIIHVLFSVTTHTYLQHFFLHFHFFDSLRVSMCTVCTESTFPVECLKLLFTTLCHVSVHIDTITRCLLWNVKFLYFDDLKKMQLMSTLFPITLTDNGIPQFHSNSWFPEMFL